MALTRVGPKYQVTIPKATREAVGLAVGDFMEATPAPGGVLLKVKSVVDKHPVIDARLREAEADVRAGRTHGPFTSVSELTQSLRPAVRRRVERKHIKKTR